MDGGSRGDPLAFYEFTGTEKVFDLIYHPAETPLLERAAVAGCNICNGYKMLRYQAAGQYRLWMGGEEPPAEFY
jgi:3-dehydroquinate dehydratase/shikimate dehydrogenase